MHALARSTWVRVALTAAILTWLASQLDMRAAIGAVLSVDLAALAGVLFLVAVDRVVMIWRWVVLLRAAGITVATKSAAWIFLVSSFVGSFLPAGVGGDAARAYVLTRRTSRGADAVASVAVDRLLGVVALGLLAAVGMFSWSGHAYADAQDAVLVAGAIVTVASISLLWMDRIVGLLLPARFREAGIGRRLNSLASAIGQYRVLPGTLVKVLALSMAVQLLRVVQAYGLGWGLGIDVPFAYYLVFMPVGLLMLLLPISVSGFGVPQGVIVWLLRPQGVPDTLSFALSTLIILIGLAGNLPGAWLYLREGRRKGASPGPESGT
jgi:uncharacterized protein (TIRG00374 family)